jgi:hypothetical protein
MSCPPRRWTEQGGAMAGLYIPRRPGPGGLQRQGGETPTTCHRRTGGPAPTWRRRGGDARGHAAPASSPRIPAGQQRRPSRGTCGCGGAESAAGGGDTWRRRPMEARRVRGVNSRGGAAGPGILRAGTRLLAPWVGYTVGFVTLKFTGRAPTQCNPAKGSDRDPHPHMHALAAAVGHRPASPRG